MLCVLKNRNNSCVEDYVELIDEPTKSLNGWNLKFEED